jgi:hypothetical protein
MKRHHGNCSATAAADAELQADVMRFVAMLALCLVAVSTLVEGNRAAPVPEVPSTTSMPSPARTGTSAPPKATPDRPSAIGGADRSPPVTAEPGSAEVDGSPSTTTAVAPVPPPEERPREQDGLSLRFATDSALLRMAARGDARVFVMSGTRTLALDLSDGIDFRPAEPPASYYAMSPGTVPRLLRQAFRGTGNGLWGVTLPERTAAEIDRYLRQSSSGVLVIDAVGRVSLEVEDD